MSDEVSEPLVPLLWGPSWHPPEGARVREVLPGDVRLRGTLAVDRGESLEVVVDHGLDEGAWDRAVDGLDEAPWQEDRHEDGELVALVCMGDLACEHLCRERSLREAADRLGSRDLVAAVPVRGILRVQAMPVGGVEDLGPLLAWADLVWRDAAAQATLTPLVPDLYRIVDGSVVERINGLSLARGREPSADRVQGLRVTDVERERERQSVWWRRVWSALRG